MKRSHLIPLVLLALTGAFATTPNATAQTTSTQATPAQMVSVRVEVSNVKNSTGLVLGNLCAEGAGPFPGPCLTHTAMATAEQGTTLLGFFYVTPGRYALQVFHDEDSNMTPSIPGEGFAFSNNPTGRPTFDAAAFTLTGDTTISVTMQYLPAAAAKALKE